MVRKAPDLRGSQGSEEVWAKAQQEADQAFEHAGDLQKNVLHIAYRLERIYATGLRPECLEKLMAALMAFATAQTAALPTGPEFRVRV